MREPSTHRPIVGVMGSGSDRHDERAAPLGAALAALGVHLLTGGGGGVMASVSEAFATVEGRQGSVIGVLPFDPDIGGSRAGYPNAWVDIPIRTHLPLSGVDGLEPMSRNHTNVLTADVIVALPGRAGTASEVQLALRYGRPIIAFIGSDSDIPDLPESVRRSDGLDEILGFVRMFAE